MKKMLKCNRCNGTGVLGHYMHIDNGVCFACGGTGEVVKQKVKRVALTPVKPETLELANTIFSQVEETSAVVIGKDFRVFKGQFGFIIELKFNQFTGVANDSWGIGSAYGLALEIESRNLNF